MTLSGVWDVSVFSSALGMSLDVLGICHKAPLSTALAPGLVCTSAMLLNAPRSLLLSASGVCHWYTLSQSRALR